MAERVIRLLRRATALALAGLSVAGPAALASGQESAPGGDSPAAQVKMTNQLQFKPARLHIQAGDTVVWHNASVLVHTVTADPAKAADADDVALPAKVMPFDSGRLAPDARFRHTFKIAGHYRYFCIPHEAAGMIGEIVVEARP